MTFTNDQWQEAIVYNANNPPGGGTQYTDGQTPPANPIGPTLVWDNGGTWLHVSAAHPLPISGSISATNPSVSTTGAAIPASATLIGASDGTNLQPLLVDASKFLKVNVAASATLPVSGTFWQATQPVSAASLPLPTNAAQETGGNLATVATNTGNIPAKGANTVANSLPITNAAVQGWIAATGTGTASQDDSLTFASQVRKVVLYNAASVPVPFEFDQTSTATSIPIQPGQYMVYDDILCTVVHVFPSVLLPINTTNGLYVKGWK